MLLCLDRDQRITYILGDVFHLASTDAAYILGISPEAYRKRLSRARGQVRTFVDAWLAFAGSGRSTQAELTTARHLRTGLRALAARNCGQTVDEADIAAAAAWVKRLPVSIQLGSGDSAIVVDGKGATRTPGEVLASYARAVEQGRWSRVKLCASPSCRWAFWDGSKNGSRKWCAMSVCGSRAKMRDYRERSRCSPALAERTPYSPVNAAQGLSQRQTVPRPSVR